MNELIDKIKILTLAKRYAYLRQQKTVKQIKQIMNQNTK